MRISTKDKLYKDHFRLIQERAIAFNKTTGFPTDELISEGDVVFMDAVATWDASAAMLSTWLHRKLNQRFFNLTKKEAIFTKCDCEQIDFVESHHKEFDPVCTTRFNDMLGKLSKEAKEVAKIILDGPSEVLDIIGTEPPKILRGILSKHLQKQGWSYAKVLSAFKEIREAL